MMLCSSEAQSPSLLLSTEGKGDYQTTSVVKLCAKLRLCPGWLGPWRQQRLGIKASDSDLLAWVGMDNAGNTGLAVKVRAVRDDPRWHKALRICMLFIIAH